METIMNQETKVLATIETIQEVKKHNNADSLHVVRVQGWDVIVNLEGMFGTSTDVIGKKVVYLQIDSIVPDTFKNESFWKYLAKTEKGMKIKSAKIRGMFSQGLILDFGTLKPLFPELDFDHLPVGTNLTNELGIVKYYEEDDEERPKEKSSTLLAFPEFLQKTDQIRLQACLDILEMLKGREYTITQKYDGQSVQWFHNRSKAGVCSRNFEVLIDRNSQSTRLMIEMNRKYSIFEKLTSYGRNISIQTEMYGHKINGNRHKKNDVYIAVFDVFDIDRNRHLPHEEAWRIAKELGLPTVTVIETSSLDRTLSDWLNLANSQRYINGPLAEGIVVKTSDNKDPYISFKVISQEFLVKHKL